MYDLNKIKNSILNGNTFEILKHIPNNSIDLVITSPPYYGLRNYNTESIVWDGKEECDHNWIKVNKSCSGGSGYKQDTNSEGCWFDRDVEYCSICGAYKGELGLEPFIEDQIIEGVKIRGFISHLIDIFNEVKRVLKPEGSLFLNMGDSYYRTNKDSKEFSDKCLSMIPERIAIRMIDNGFILRNKICWYKSNAFPNPAKDRFSPDWENVYFFVKNKDYYFIPQYIDITNYNKMVCFNDSQLGNEKEIIFKGLRCTWDIPLETFSTKKLNINDYSHHATFPKKLVEIPISSSCPENGIVLDIFAGTSTAAIVAKNMNRNFIMIELSSESCNISRRRLEKEVNLFDINVFDKNLNLLKDERNCSNCLLDCMLKDFGEVCINWSDKK